MSPTALVKDDHYRIYRVSLACGALAFGAFASGPALAAPRVFPTGTTIYDPAEAYASDLLFTAADHKTYLIDMNGAVVRSWDKEGFPAKMVDPALAEGAKGVVGLQLSSIPAGEGGKGGGTGVVPGMSPIFRNSLFGLVDWNGQVVWQWGLQAPGGAALQHHDWARLANGHTLILSSVSHKIDGFGDRMMVDDVIYDVAADGKIVWTWTASEHLGEFGFTPSALDLIKRTPNTDFLHANDMQVIGPNRLARAGDSRFAPDNIVLSSRDANVTVIIDRNTGGIVWRLGPDYPPRVEGKPEITRRAVDQISGQHDAHIIPEGLPGAGDILMFDNQGSAGYPPVKLQTIGGSRVLEIDPIERRIVWEYTGNSSGQADWSFYSAFISSAERLPNGNTLINEGVSGRFFQVTPAGKIVWEYVSPFLGQSDQGPLPGRAPSQSNWVYRVQAVPFAWVPEPPHAPLPVSPKAGVVNEH